MSTPLVQAVNLGGWLVVEGWIKPSLFDGILNNDLLDGTCVRLKSVVDGRYLCADKGGGATVHAGSWDASVNETFKLWRINESSFNFRVANGQFIGLDRSGEEKNVVAEATTPGKTEEFEIQRNPDDLHRVRIKASNGFFLKVTMEEVVTADYYGSGGGWGDDNPSVFVIEIGKIMRGEYQLTNGYGPDLAPQVMQEHWSKFIQEEDFKFISENGLNAVRIPVGWWIAHDPCPPKPYVGGSLKALDNAFCWAEKYGIKVIIDLHAAPGSQSGWEPSSSRDGTQEWGDDLLTSRHHFHSWINHQDWGSSLLEPLVCRDGFHAWGHTEDSIQQTVDVIDFLTARYAMSSSLFAVELMNEPLSPGVTLETLLKYYKAGYNAVRKHSDTAYVVLSDRFGPHKSKELYELASKLTRPVIDVHYYNLYTDKFKALNVEQNMEYVYNERSRQLDELISPGGPLIFIGEWVDEWEVKGATKEEYRKFGEAQLDVFGRATFGWSYWTLKNVNNYWSLEWMIKNGYIKIRPISDC